MGALVNQQILLVSRPIREPRPDNFRLVRVPLLDPRQMQDGQVLVRHHFLSLDPYMRGRMDEGTSYAVPQPLDQVMLGATAGEVIASKTPEFKVGDTVVGYGGWQEYSLVDGTRPGALRKVDTTRLALSAYLGAVGMPGVAAWYGLTQIIEPKAGSTLVVSAASGAVGSVVGQLAKLRGCRVVGLAGGDHKCRFVTEELGFDACIDYKQYGDLQSLSEALQRSCPKGIDACFENVGGVILDAVMQQANAFARIAVCGMIAGYNGAPQVMANPTLILVTRMKIEGFIVGDHLAMWPPALLELSELVASGQLKYRETVSHGLASAPEAFIGLLGGKNFGKQLVKLH